MIFDPSSYETYSIKQKNFSVLLLSFRTAPKCDCWNAIKKSGSPLFFIICNNQFLIPFLSAGSNTQAIAPLHFFYDKSLIQFSNERIIIIGKHKFSFDVHQLVLQKNVLTFVKNKISCIVVFLLSVYRGLLYKERSPQYSNYPFFIHIRHNFIRRPSVLFQ